MKHYKNIAVSQIQIGPLSFSSLAQRATNGNSALNSLQLPLNKTLHLEPVLVQKLIRVTDLKLGPCCQRA